MIRIARTKILHDINNVNMGSLKNYWHQLTDIANKSLTIDDNLQSLHRYELVEE